MPRTVETTVYSFDELDDAAKERARAWYREDALDHDWWDSTYEEAARIAALFGLDINMKPVKLMSGKTRMGPAIYFSGFFSQGDGACFEGDYKFKDNAIKALAEYAPKDETLAQIVSDLMDAQAANGNQLSARVRHHGPCFHMDIDVFCDGEDANDDASEAIAEALRDFANWIYRTLESEYEYFMSDECVDDTIRANEYEFTKDGARA